MPTDESVDKTYVKKHKLNNTLNELFLALTQNKPENPIEFAKEFFQSKLPPAQPTPTLKREPSLLNVSNENNSVSAALSTLSTLNRVNRIVVKTNKKASEDELIENEIIVYTRDTLNELEEGLDKLEIASYKNDLKKREMLNKHKSELRNLIEKNLNNLNKENEAKREKVLTRSNKNKIEIISEEILLEDYDSEDEELLLNEIGMADNSNYVAKKKKKLNKKKEDKRVSYRAINKNHSLDNTMMSEKNLDSSRQHHVYICSVCGKTKNTNQISNTLNHKLNEPDEKDNVTSPKEDEKKSNEKNFFELLASQNLENKQKVVNETFDDDRIESASQVSGPRPITPFDAGTSRSLNKLDETGTSAMSSGVLGWILSTQQHMKMAEVNEETRSEKRKNSSSTVSKASTLKDAKQNVSTNSELQQWKLQSTSASELSARSKMSKASSKKV